MPAAIPPALPVQDCTELQTASTAYGFTVGTSYGPLGRLLAFRCDGYARPAGVFMSFPRNQWTEIIALVYAGAIALQAQHKD